MQYVKIELTRKGVTKEQKQALIKGAMELIRNVLNEDRQLTLVVIQEYNQGDWGQAGEHIPVRLKGYDC